MIQLLYKDLFDLSTLSSRKSFDILRISGINGKLWITPAVFHVFSAKISTKKSPIFPKKKGLSMQSALTNTTTAIL